VKINSVIVWLADNCGRLKQVRVGVSDVAPEASVIPASPINMAMCGTHDPPVPCSATLTVTCPPGGITGRYLIVQLEGSGNLLTICELTAYTSEFFILGHRIIQFEIIFWTR